ncbi:Peptidase inhibitor R3HDML [Willisornis vidua]|uniref:Peptidase inhibitor R3HDML n=1 Tax=Willisornis vidua TaxID=1566151 RepID=A0ABQ9D5C7_9PASS|nr:Peptidase inhibitor R3HDML [Willisornis vidua]
MAVLHLHLYLTALGCWVSQLASSFLLPNATELLSTPGGTAAGLLWGVGVPRSRRKRYLSPHDMSVILDYHNQVRAHVSPPAANMEYMVWDERLARAAEAWAARCLWDHGPPELMKYVGQNLSIQSGRYRSVIDMVKSWHQEKQHYSFPHPHECNPRCPSKCSGSVCSHYTQGKLLAMLQDEVWELIWMVWATSSRLGCALGTCANVRVWGSTWRHTTLLVCNYAIKGNWQGEAPYKVGRPCSACPPTYGGSCSNNMCFSGVKSNQVSWF